VKLEYKKLLYGERKRIEHVYFLEEGVASLVNTMSSGDAVEVGTIGNEGVVRFPALMEDDDAGSRLGAEDRNRDLPPGAGE
jgi:hypothetical protein